MKIFDPYIRSRSQGGDDLRNLHYFGTEEVLTVAYGSKRFEDAGELLADFEELIEEEVRRLRRCGLIGHVALGVSPAAQPRRTHYEVWDALPKLLERPNVAALGEIGVWEDSQAQWQLFQRQVEMAREAGPLPILLMPPKELKRTLTYKMIGRLEKWDYPAELVVVNRVGERLARNVIESGCMVTIPVGAAGNDPRETARWIGALLGEVAGGEEKIMFSADLRATGADVLGVPKTMEALKGEGLGDEEVEKMVYQNARRLFVRS